MASSRACCRAAAARPAASSMVAATERIEIRGHESESVQRPHADDQARPRERTGHDPLEAPLSGEMPRKRSADAARIAGVRERTVARNSTIGRFSKHQRGRGRVDDGAFHGGPGEAGGIGARVCSCAVAPGRAARRPPRPAPRIRRARDPRMNSGETASRTRASRDGFMFDPLPSSRRAVSSISIVCPSSRRTSSLVRRCPACYAIPANRLGAPLPVIRRQGTPAPVSIGQRFRHRHRPGGEKRIGRSRRGSVSCTGRATTPTRPCSFGRTDEGLSRRDGG